MSSGSIKGFYRQKKKTAGTGGISKPSSYKKASAATGKRAAAATLGGGATVQLAALVSHGSLDLDEHDHTGEEEMLLQQFDMDMKYGPCLGMTRLERWQRASRMALDPPRTVGDALLLAGGANKVGLECLWEGRI